MFLHQFQEETGFPSSVLLKLDGSRWPNVPIAKKPNAISDLNTRKINRFPSWFKGLTYLQNDQLALPVVGYSPAEPTYMISETHLPASETNKQKVVSFMHCLFTCPRYKYCCVGSSKHTLPCGPSCFLNSINYFRQITHRNLKMKHSLFNGTIFAVNGLHSLSLPVANSIPHRD